MNPWSEIAIAILSGVAGFGLGYFSSRLPKNWWMLGYFLPMLLILFYAVGIHYPASLSSISGFSWMFIGRKRFLVMDFVAAMVLATLLYRLPQGRDRRALLVLIVAMVFGSSIWPSLAPLLNHRQLAQLHTQINAEGVCLQSTDYTCGPAAAVTVLRQMGLPAEEGEIAILSQTSSTTGTPPELLATALAQRYGRDGLSVEYRFFKNLEELRQAGLTLAVVKYSFMVDHYVAVLKVTDSAVILGDPLNGLETVSRDEFLKRWRYCGVVIKK